MLFVGADPAFVEVVALTVVLTLAFDFTLGNFTSFDLALVFADAFAFLTFVVFLIVSLVIFCFVVGAFFRAVADLETEARAFETALLTPDLTTFRFLFRREVDSSISLPIFRFAVVFVTDFFGLDFDRFWLSILDSLSLDRCSFSLGRGPKTPRHSDEPHRHCWTFFWEYGLESC